MVLHLAGETQNVDNWDEHFEVTAGGTINVLRACGRGWGPACRADEHRQHDVRLGMGRQPAVRSAGGRRAGSAAWDLLDYRTPPRPDSPYGAAKLFCEAAARWFSDQTPMSVLVIRLGAVLAENRPMLIRHFPGFLAQEDAVQMIDKCLSAPADVRFGIFDAISENSLRWRDTTPAKEVLGWRPTGSSDEFDPSELTR